MQSSTEKATQPFSGLAPLPPRACLQTYSTSNYASSLLAHPSRHTTISSTLMSIRVTIIHLAQTRTAMDWYLLTTSRTPSVLWRIRTWWKGLGRRRTCVGSFSNHLPVGPPKNHINLAWGVLEAMWCTTLTFWAICPSFPTSISGPVFQGSIAFVNGETDKQMRQPVDM